jgi:beta-lysine 5,6-aminomutase beta subunit
MAIIGRTGATPPDLTRVRPYGDTLDDGAVQLSFTLPVPFGDEAREAARLMAIGMGLTEPSIYHGADLGEGYSFFIVYARTAVTVDFTKVVVPKVEGRRMTKTEIDTFIAEQVGRKLVLLGACTGTDAHTVGIDAIMNLKGIAGEKGLESYHEIEAHNLGSQVSNEALIEAAYRYNADALLVSQIVTQKDIHKTNLTELIGLLAGRASVTNLPWSLATMPASGRVRWLPMWQGSWRNRLWHVVLRRGVRSAVARQVERNVARRGLR